MRPLGTVSCMDERLLAVDARVLSPVWGHGVVVELVMRLVVVVRLLLKLLPLDGVGWSVRVGIGGREVLFLRAPVGPLWDERGRLDLHGWLRCGSIL